MNPLPVRDGQTITFCSGEYNGRLGIDGAHNVTKVTNNDIRYVFEGILVGTIGSRDVIDNTITGRRPSARFRKRE